MVWEADGKSHLESAVVIIIVTYEDVLVYAPAPATAYTWKPEDIFGELVFACYLFEAGFLASCPCHASYSRLAGP